MNRENLNFWLSLIANIGVLGGLLFVGYEIRQNTVQLRAESSRSITASVNDLNVGIYSDAELVAILIKGTKDRGALNPVERYRFDTVQFSRLNIAEYVLDLEREGVSDLNFRYVDWVVRDFNRKPGLRQFIRDHEESYVGSADLLARLLGEAAEEQP
ncbi:MAG: hypothetical protein GTN86_04170 [Xanthomonadales bacterium]|nr:hypothetical protein [Xanthomonadales bacterium]NIN58687.1 hypothetical protein [Xanthomonadales bacterium]NIN74537.1 hypothetical protein [Xanthomonadales bacterium]NIO14842.1 hypothetical protein [Xanthomonadales bacterium]NIP11080.1 hypothetical protein [Xanthomonadales bacterium]